MAVCRRADKEGPHGECRLKAAMQAGRQLGALLVAGGGARRVSE